MMRGCILGGVLLFACAGCVSPVPGRTVTVTDFGAVPDDMKDDTAQIQAGIDAAARLAERRGKPVTVLFPAGTYIISLFDNATYALLLKPNLTYQGERDTSGVVQSRLILNPARSIEVNHQTRLLAFDESMRAENIAIRDLELDGSEAAFPAGWRQSHGIFSGLVGGENILVQGCKVHDIAGTAIRFGNDARFDHVRVVANEVFHYRENGIEFAPGRDLEASLNFVHDALYGAFAIRRETGPGTGFPTENVRFIRNRIRNSAGIGVSGHRAPFTATVSKVIIKNNSMDDVPPAAASAPGVHLCGVTEASVESNVILRCRSRGIDVLGCADIEIVGNRIEGTRTYGGQIDEGAVFVGETYDPRFPSENITIKANVLVSNAVAGCRLGWLVAESDRRQSLRASVVRNRIALNDGPGIVLANSHLTVVRGNVITDNGGPGVLLTHAASGNTFLQNEVLRHTAAGGILVEATAGADNRFTRGNVIVGNQPFGLCNKSPFVVDARFNYWGSPDGPGHPGCDLVKQVAGAGDVPVEPCLKKQP